MYFETEYSIQNNFFFKTRDRRFISTVSFCKTKCLKPGFLKIIPLFCAFHTTATVTLQAIIRIDTNSINPLSPELNPICYLLALLGAHHFLHVSRIRVRLLTFRLIMSYLYGAPILDVSRSHTTTQHSR